MCVYVCLVCACAFRAINYRYTYLHIIRIPHERGDGNYKNVHHIFVYKLYAIRLSEKQFFFNLYNGSSGRGGCPPPYRGAIVACFLTNFILHARAHQTLLYWVTFFYHPHSCPKTTAWRRRILSERVWFYQFVLASFKSVFLTSEKTARRVEKRVQIDLCSREVATHVRIVPTNTKKRIIPLSMRFVQNLKIIRNFIQQLDKSY